MREPDGFDASWQRYFERTAHSRMNMGIVIDIFNRETARGLRMLRTKYA